MGTIRFSGLAAIVICTASLVQAQQPALRFIALAPCRIADTRDPNGPFGGPAISGQSSRSFVIPGSCGVPSAAKAYSLNVTAVPHAYLGYLTVWPTGQSQPTVSTLNSTDGRVKANAAIVPAGTNGAISIYVTDTTDVVLDINGYFVLASDVSALAFFPLPPCRLVDTRDLSGPLGGPSLASLQERSLAIRSGNCNIPSSALAYSLNFTAVAPHGLGFLSTWPSGMPRPLVSTLNAPTGQVTANAAIVPAGTPNGAISVLASSEADVIIDINGYFAAPESASNPLSLYTFPPCRVLDTRETSGSFHGTMSHDTTARTCGVIAGAQAIVLNATVVPLQSLSFLSLWPSGQTRPWVSTLNASDALVTSNMAIVPTTSGAVDAFATDLTNLVLDTTGYFAAGTNPAPTMYTLTVTRSGSGTGSVASLDNKISCGAVCAVSYESGTTVTLVASSSGGSIFAGWSGSGCSGTGSCTVTLSAARFVTATFNPPPSVVGRWFFAAASSLYPVYSYGDGTLQQNGSSVTGEFYMTGSPCAAHVTLSGTLTGLDFTFQVLEGSQYVSFTGTLNSSLTYAWGTYSAPLGGCVQGDYGTWTASKYVD